MRSEKITATYGRKTIVKLVARGALIGVFAGSVTVLYRWMLGNTEGFLFKIINDIKGNPLKTAVWLAALGVIGLFVSLVVKFEPMSSGSGIPQISGEIKGFFSPSWWRVIIAKLIGGASSVFAGLSLGREGPSVQFGGMAAKGVAKLTGADDKLTVKMIACGAGAGLAAAFNAPLAGVLFVLEEIIQRFDRQVLCMGFVAAVTADFISKIFFGQSTVFSYQTQNISLKHYWIFIILGVLLGLFGVLYNFVMSKTSDMFKAISKKVPRPAVFAVFFILSGVVGIFVPSILGGGNKMVELLINEKPELNALFFLLVAKFIFSALSSGTGAPGGSLQPLLILGTYAGAIFGTQASNLLDLSPDAWQLFVVVAMAGLFASIVRSPLTAIILVFETTGNMSNLLPLITVSLISYAVADFCKSEPIYETLLRKMTPKNQEITSN